ncbi:MAG: hypothetical protein AAEB43_05535, partial [Acidimicrobiales bacterium]
MSAAVKKNAKKASGGRQIRRRSAFAGFTFILAAAFFGWRLLNLQVLQNDQRYQEFGSAQSIRTVTLPAGRGAIIDRNGVDLALSVPLQSLIVDPRLVIEPGRSARALADLISTSEETLYNRLASDRSFAYLVRQ